MGRVQSRPAAKAHGHCLCNWLCDDRAWDEAALYTGSFSCSMRNCSGQKMFTYLLAVSASRKLGHGYLPAHGRF